MKQIKLLFALTLLLIPAPLWARPLRINEQEVQCTTVRTGRGYRSRCEVRRYQSSVKRRQQVEKFQDLEAQESRRSTRARGFARARARWRVPRVSERRVPQVFVDLGRGEMMEVEGALDPEELLEADEPMDWEELPSFEEPEPLERQQIARAFEPGPGSAQAWSPMAEWPQAPAVQGRPAPAVEVPSHPASAESKTAEGAVLELLNQAREQRGLPALVPSPLAAAVAVAHSQDMCQRRYFSHQSPEGVRPWDRLRQAGGKFSQAAENIASGYLTAEEVHQGWMNSPGHRANRLNPRYTHVGIGVYQCEDGRPFWTELFFR